MLHRGFSICIFSLTIYSTTIYAFTSLNARYSVSVNERHYGFKRDCSTALKEISGNNNENKTNKRKILRYDNVGDPIYEGEENAVTSSEGLNVLGIKLALDPASLSLLIFGVIAFNFFVLANL